MRSYQFATLPPTLREQEDEHVQLEQANFNLKMRIFHLEEQLRSSTYPIGEEDIRDENIQQRQLLAEARQELDQKEQSLQRAKVLIQSLKEQLDNTVRMGNNVGSAHQTELQQTKRQLREATQEQTYVIEELRSKVTQMQRRIEGKDSELDNLHDKLSQAQRQKDDFETQLRKSRNEIDLVQQQLQLFQHSMENSSEEMAQLRVDNEMLRIEVEAKTSDLIAYESKIGDLIRTQVRMSFIPVDKGDEENDMQELDSMDRNELVETLREATSKAKRDSAKHVATLTESYDARIHALESELQRLIAENENLSLLRSRVEELQTKNKKYEEVDADHQRALMEITSLQQNSQQLQEQNEGYTQRIARLESLNEALQQKLDHISKHSAERENSVKSLAQQVSDQSAEIQHLQVVVETLSTKLDETKDEKSEVSLQLVQAEKDAAIIQRQLDKATFEKNVVDRDIRKLEIENVTLQEKLGQAELELRQVSHDMQAQDDRILQLSSNNAILEAASAATSGTAKKAEGLELELSFAKQKLAEFASLNDAAVSARTAQAVAEERCRIAQGRIEELSKSLREANTEIHELKHQLVNEQSQSNAVQKQLTVEQEQHRLTVKEAAECQKKLNDVFMSDRVRVIPTEVFELFQRVAAALKRWNSQLTTMIGINGVPRICFDQSIPQIDITGKVRSSEESKLSEVNDEELSYSEDLPQFAKEVATLTAAVDDKIDSLQQLRETYQSSCEIILAKCDKMTSELVARVDVLDLQLVAARERIDADGFIHKRRQSSIREVELAHKKMIESLSNELHVATDEAIGTKEQLQVMRTQLDKTNHELSALHADFSSSKEIMLGLRGEIKALKDQLLLKEQENHSMHETQQMLQAQLTTRDEKINRLSENHRTLILDMEDYTKRHDIEKEKVATLNEEKTTLLDAVSKLTEQLETRETALSEHQEYIEKLQQKIERLKHKQELHDEFFSTRHSPRRQRAATQQPRTRSPTRISGTERYPLDGATPDTRATNNYNNNNTKWENWSDRPLDNHSLQSPTRFARQNPTSNARIFTPSNRAERMERLDRMDQDLQILTRQLDSILDKSAPNTNERTEPNRTNGLPQRAKISRWSATR